VIEALSATFENAKRLPGVGRRRFQHPVKLVPGHVLRAG
jgi:hypothetical protein